jgi:hypothetical protein
MESCDLVVLLLVLRSRRWSHGHLRTTRQVCRIDESPLPGLGASISAWWCCHLVVLLHWSRDSRDCNPVFGCTEKWVSDAEEGVRLEVGSCKSSALVGAPEEPKGSFPRPRFRVLLAALSEGFSQKGGQATQAHRVGALVGATAGCREGC